MFTPRDLIWLFFLISSLQPAIQKAMLAQTRRRTLATIASKRDATVVTLIHRQETLALLGIPLARYIDIDDSKSVLQTIRETQSGRPSRSSSTRRAASSWPRVRSRGRSTTMTAASSPWCRITR